MLSRQQQKDPRGGDFLSFLKDKGASGTTLTQAQRDTLFNAFLKWQKQRSSAQR